MKFLAPFYIIAYALLAAGPALDCHEFEAHSAHDDYCQGCLYGNSVEATFEKSVSTVPSRESTGPALYGIEPDATTPQSGILGSRAPPVLA